jgi:hypothetical protein
MRASAPYYLPWNAGFVALLMLLFGSVINVPTRTCAARSSCPDAS